MSLFSLLPVTFVPSVNIALVSFAGVSPAITLGMYLSNCQTLVCLSVGFSKSVIISFCFLFKSSKFANGASALLAGICYLAISCSLDSTSAFCSLACTLASANCLSFKSTTFNSLAVSDFSFDSCSHTHSKTFKNLTSKSFFGAGSMSSFNVQSLSLRIFQLFLLQQSHP